MKRAALFLALAACGSPSAPRHIELSTPSTTQQTVLPEITITTTSAPRPTTTVRASRSARVTPTPSRPNPRGCGGWEGLIGQYPWPVDQACRVMMCESGGRADARNPSSSATGLFQILRGPLDPAENVRVAYGMWSSRGWQPWNASRGCWA